MKLQLLLTIFILTNTILLSQDKGDSKPDSSQYDETFLARWEDLISNGIALRKDSIIIDNEISEVILIPTDLPIKEDVNYSAVKNDTIYSLVVTRLNYTNVKFSIVGKHKQIIVFKRRDIAILESTFHLGAEGIYENKDGEMYPMNDYNIDENGDQKLLIPVGTTEAIHYYESTEGKPIELFFSKTDK